MPPFPNAAVTLVLLPGMDGGGTLFADVIEALGPAINPVVIAYPADQPLDYAGLTAFVRARLPVDRPFYLLGESFSGPVAIALAGEAPPGLRGLILSCTFARNPVPTLGLARPLVAVLPVSHHAAPLLMPFLLGRWTSPRMRAAVREAIAVPAPAVLRARLRAVLGADAGGALRQITVPMLYLQAAQDRVVGPAALHHIQSTRPDMQVARIDGPHLLLQAVPEAAANEILGFVTRSEAVRAGH